MGVEEVTTKAKTGFQVFRWRYYGHRRGPGYICIDLSCCTIQSLFVSGFESGRPAWCRGRERGFGCWGCGDARKIGVSIVSLALLWAPSWTQEYIFADLDVSAIQSLFVSGFELGCPDLEGEGGHDSLREWRREQVRVSIISLALLWAPSETAAYFFVDFGVSAI